MKNKLIKYTTSLKKRAEEKRDEAAFEKTVNSSPYLDPYIHGLNSEAAELEKVIGELENLINA